MIYYRQMINHILSERRCSRCALKIQSASFVWRDHAGVRTNSYQYSSCSAWRSKGINEKLFEFWDWFVRIKSICCYGLSVWNSKYPIKHGKDFIYFKKQQLYIEHGPLHTVNNGCRQRFWKQSRIYLETTVIPVRSAQKSRRNGELD